VVVGGAQRVRRLRYGVPLDRPRSSRTAPLFTNVVEEEFPEVHIPNPICSPPIRPCGGPGAQYKPPPQGRIKRLRACLCTAVNAVVTKNSYYDIKNRCWFRWIDGYHARDRGLGRRLALKPAPSLALEYE
jgi:hypothetical protein